MLEPNRIKLYANPALGTQEIRDLSRHYMGQGVHTPDDLERLFSNTSLVLAIYVDDRLEGVLRALTDFTAVCYVTEWIPASRHSDPGLLEDLLSKLPHYLDPEVSVILAPGLLQTLLAPRTAPGRHIDRVGEGGFYQGTRSSRRYPVAGGVAYRGARLDKAGARVAEVPGSG